MLGIYTVNHPDLIHWSPWPNQLIDADDASLTLNYIKRGYAKCGVKKRNRKYRTEESLNGMFAFSLHFYIPSFQYYMVVDLLVALNFKLTRGGWINSHFKKEDRRKNKYLPNTFILWKLRIKSNKEGTLDLSPEIEGLFLLYFFVQLQKGFETCLKYLWAAKSLTEFLPHYT